MEDNKVEKLEEALQRIDNKQNKIMFYLPNMPQASGGIGVVYEHVKTLVELGFDACIIHDNKEYKKPEWLGTEYCNLKHFALDKDKLSVNSDDMLIIPEGFSNIMEQTKNMPCMRIVLCQSYLYVLGSLTPGLSWSNFNIKDVIVVNSTLEQYLEKIFGKGRFDIKVCRPSINENIFKPSDKPKKPVIAVSARNQQEMLNMVKQFYAVYPQFKWVSFKDMRDMSREDFAETLRECCLGVWIDRVAGFGTFPIECAKSNVPCISLVPDIVPEYAKDENGIYVPNILSIADTVAAYFKLWFEDKEPKELFDGIAELAKEYSVAEEKESIKTIYTNYMESRKQEIAAVIEKLKVEV